MVQIHYTNLVSALQVAIETRRQVEKAHGYTGDSIFVAGLVEVLDQMKRGEELQVIGQHD